MAKKPLSTGPAQTPAAVNGIEAMLLASYAQAGDTLQTGRYLVTFKEGAQESGMKAMKSQGMRSADARDFTNQAVDVADIGDADTLMFPEIGVALVSGPAMQARGLGAQDEIASDSPM
jgi:subtilisin